MEHVQFVTFSVIVSQYRRPLLVDTQISVVSVGWQRYPFSNSGWRGQNLVHLGSSKSSRKRGSQKNVAKGKDCSVLRSDSRTGSTYSTYCLQRVLLFANLV